MILRKNLLHSSLDGTFPKRVGFMDSPTYSLFEMTWEVSTETPRKKYHTHTHIYIYIPSLSTSGPPTNHPTTIHFAVRATAGGVHSSRAICSAEADLNRENSSCAWAFPQCIYAREEHSISIDLYRSIKIPIRFYKLSGLVWGSSKSMYCKM